jgi:hypothetical protein
VQARRQVAGAIGYSQNRCRRSDVVFIGEQVQPRAFPLRRSAQRLDCGGIDRFGAAVMAVGLAREHRLIQVGEVWIGAVGQFQDGAQWRSVRMIGNGDGP